MLHLKVTQLALGSDFTVVVTGDGDGGSRRVGSNSLEVSSNCPSTDSLGPRPPLPPAAEDLRRSEEAQRPKEGGEASKEEAQDSQSVEIIANGKAKAEEKASASSPVQTPDDPEAASVDPAKASGSVDHREE